MLNAQQINQLSDEQRIEMFQRLEREIFGEKYFRNVVTDRLGVARSSYHRWMTGGTTIPTPVLLLLQEWELRERLTKLLAGAASSDP